MKALFARLHQQKSLPPTLWPLLPLAWLYGLGVRLRLAAYRWGLLWPIRLPVPVVSVGNLTTGGTGKTPVVITLAKQLTEAGYRVVVLCRGYGAPRPVAYDRPTHPDHGDEAFLIQQQVPDAVVIVGKHRAQNALRAIADYQPDVVLLDDGFQYLRLARDVNIALVDGEYGFGNGHLLPLGPLREPLDQICRADRVWVTVPDTVATLSPTLAARLQHMGQGNIPVSLVSLQPEGIQTWENNTAASVAPLLGRPAIVFSALAQPERFEQQVAALGFNIIQTLRFADHHPYSEADVDRIFSTDPLTPPTALNPVWITTAKDRVKLLGRLPEAITESVYTLNRLCRLPPLKIPRLVQPVTPSTVQTPTPACQENPTHATLSC